MVATASLELGIDMGAIDLVCQVESPGSVARALQRVGRAGHLVGGTSKGRLIPKTPRDLLEQAVFAREMAAGRVEAIRVPINCLDVLAQQIVAMTAHGIVGTDLPFFNSSAEAYPYRNLSPEAFEKVLEMVSGRYRWRQGKRNPAGLNALQPASAGIGSTTGCWRCQAASDLRTGQWRHDSGYGAVSHLRSCRRSHRRAG